MFQPVVVIRIPRLALLLATTALAVGAFLAAPALSAAQQANWLNVANKGIANARTKGFFNPGEDWYNVFLNDGRQYPLATVWDVVPLLEAIDGRALADPSKTNRKYAADHAKYAERYWNGDLPPHGGYAPYPGDRGASDHVWFDDNSWWGLQFVDAYRATHNKRFLKDAKKASDYVDASGWDGGGGMWWESQHQSHSLEALASATALSADIYLYTKPHNTTYKDRALKYISWADSNARHDYPLYSNDTQPVMTYVEGSMIGAQLALCQAGRQSSCGRAEDLANAAINWWGWYPYPNQCPQTDTIMFRFLVQLSGYDRNPRWWDWAAMNAQQALDRAKTGGLFLNFWDGSSPLAHGGCQDQPNQLKVHGAAVEMFAWLAAVPRP
ncbi:MAG: hypothetical protein JOZ25_10975 [Actinobacteria bacterium]|nr:hypothetical protein [Actinomycetota bacterium]